VSIETEIAQEVARQYHAGNVGTGRGVLTAKKVASSLPGRSYAYVKETVASSPLSMFLDKALEKEGLKGKVRVECHGVGMYRSWRFVGIHEEAEATADAASPVAPEAEDVTAEDGEAQIKKELANLDYTAPPGSEEDRQSLKA
jgi:hypothetical protein